MAALLRERRRRRSGRRRGGLIARSAMLSLLVFSTLFLGGCRQESSYPSRPIFLICPWSAGGGTDQVSRKVAHELEARVGVPVNVINATGGGGVTGHTRGALAEPDGYTLTMITVELNMLHWRGMTPITYEDYRPAVLLNRDAAALFVRSDAPWSSASELAEAVRNRADELTASGTARGGIWHLAFAGWLRELGLEPDAVTWMSTNGARPSLQQLLAGGVDIVSCSVPEAKLMLDSGKVRCLGVMAEERLDQFPEIPTLKEQGLDWAMGGWRGVAMPAGTPDPIANKITEALIHVVKSDAFRDFMRTQGFNWSFMGPEAFGSYLERMDQKFGDLLTSPAFKASMAQYPIGPRFFPALLAVAGVIVLVGMAVTRSFRVDPGAPALDRRGLGHMAELVLAIPVYVLLVERIGFVMTAAALLLFLLWRLGVRWRVSLPVTVVISVVVYQIFAVYLRVPLPRGWLGW